MLGMRDPLSWVPIKFKLPLTFLCICVVAFGVGGVVVTSTAREALETQIRLRLDERATATKLIIGRHLDLIGRRIEDFASDGFIRNELAAGGSARLRRHLIENKLPLVAAFVDACVTDAGDRPVLNAHHTWPVPKGVGTTMYGPLRRQTQSHPYPTFLLSTPVTSIEGGRKIGSLHLLVRADTWVHGLTELAALPDAGIRRMALYDLAGLHLPLASGTTTDDVIAFTATIPRNGWRLELAVDRAEALQPITALSRRYLWIGGLLLALVACVVFFPVRFLVRPLASFRVAAQRIAAGDFRARVSHESRDEIGDLATAFNIMAEGVEERTGKLKEAAATLHRRESDIRFERDRLTTVIRSMQDGLFILDRDGKVTLSNAAAQPVVKALDERAARPEPLDCKSDLDCLRCLTDLDHPHKTCVMQVDERLYEVHATTLPAAGNITSGRVCVSRDITGRIAEGEQQSHQERMTVLGEIAAVMAHELNNPLAAISMFGQMLEGQIADDGPARESAEVIRRNAETCKRTIRGLLDMAAQATAEATEFDVHELIGDVQEFLQPLYRRVSVTVGMVPGAISPLLVGDELQLRQVIVNLVMNAVHAMEDGGGKVTITTGDLPGGVRIDVGDEGPGISMDAREHIFQPFYTTKAAGTGTGLGLPTSRRIVQTHGGTLELLGTGPEGTTFRIELPREGTRAAWQTRARMARGVLTERFGDPGEIEHAG